MNVANELAQLVADRIREVSRAVPGSIGDQMGFQVVDHQAQDGTITMTCETAPWMCNFAGTLHGGMCAAIVDQAMGFVSYCLKPGEGAAPTVQLSVNYHRPLIPGEPVLVKVHVVSVTRSLMSLTAEAAVLSSPEKICLSASGIYFFKRADG